MNPPVPPLWNDLLLHLEAPTNGASDKAFVVLQTVSAAQQGKRCGTVIVAEPVDIGEPLRRIHAQLPLLSDYVQRDDLPLGTVECLGSALADLIPNAVRHTLIEQIGVNGLPIRLRLRADNPILAALPWEFIRFDTLPHGGYLGLQSRFALVRETDTESTFPVPSLPLPPQRDGNDPIRVLIAWANPANARFPHLEHLRGESEAILTSLRQSRHGANGKIAVQEIRHATPSALRAALHESRPDIVHCIGHGEARPTGGLLVLHGERSGSHAYLYADELADWLRGSDKSNAPVPLVVLSACWGGTPVRGIAETLIRRHAAASVVAMQFPLRDSTGEWLTRAFYDALVCETPASIEDATQQARQMVRGLGADWGVPVLYRRLPINDQPIFPPFTPPLNLPSTVPSVRLPIQTNLPFARSGDFVGRDNILIELHTLLHSGKSAALVGIGGIGKTMTVSEYAHAHRADYPGGIFWIGAQNTEQILEEYAALGRFFDLPKSGGIRERAALVRDRLQSSALPILLIFDNLTEACDLSLLPTVATDCRILVTTRERWLTGRRFARIELPPLDKDAALALLQSRCPEMAVDADDRTAAEQIIALLGGLPLALALVSSHVERLGRGFADYRETLMARPLESLERARARFLSATGHGGSVFDTVELAYDSLTEAARKVLGAASCFAPQGISQAQLWKVSGIKRQDDFAEAIGELYDRSLVVREEENEYIGLQEIVRVYAQSRLSISRRRALLTQTAGLLTQSLKTANDKMDWRTASRLAPHARTVAEFIRTLRTPLAQMPGLLQQTGGYLLWQGENRQAVALLDEALRLAKLQKEASDTADILGALGDAARERRDFIEAHACYAEALTIARDRFGADDVRVAPYESMVGVAIKMGFRNGVFPDLQEALPYYERALAIAQSVHGDRNAFTASCLSNLGMYWSDAGDLERALEYVEKAMAIDTVIFGANHSKIAIRNNNCGQIYAKMDNFAAAQHCHERALIIYETIYGKRHPYVAESVAWLSDARQKQGYAEEAVLGYTEAAEILTQFYGAHYRDVLLIRKKIEELRRAVIA